MLVFVTLSFILSSVEGEKIREFSFVGCNGAILCV